jgi:hypothetical protein
MPQYVVITLDLNGVNLRRLHLSFHGVSSASLDYISDSQARIVSMVKLDKRYNNTSVSLACTADNLDQKFPVP